MEYREIKLKAEGYVKERYPSNCEILREEEIKSPYGWYFIANVKTNDVLLQYVGSGGFFIDGATGEIIEFGTGQLINRGLDWWLDKHKKGFKFGNYRLIIEEIYNLEMVIQIIVHQRISYVLPEIERDVLYRIPKVYNAKVLKNRLKELPCEFSTLSLENLIDMMEEGKLSNYCKFTYNSIEYKRISFEWRADKATEKDKQPIW